MNRPQFIHLKMIDELPITPEQKKAVLDYINELFAMTISRYGMHYQQFYCPRCNFNEEGATVYEGELYNPCDPGCCTQLKCPKCKRVYNLQESEESNDIK